METAAAAANAVERIGKKDTNATSPGTPNVADMDSRYGISTTAAVAAAQNAERADVKGRMAALRDPWLAYLCGGWAWVTLRCPRECERETRGMKK